MPAYVGSRRALMGGGIQILTLVVQPDGTAGKDAHILSAQATTNDGASAIMNIGERNDQVTSPIRALIQFDLSGIPAAATILSATLALWANADFSSNARTLRAFRLKRAWVEAEATWNIYSTGNNWESAGGFGEADCEQTDIGSLALTDSETVPAFKLIPLTASAVQEWVDGTLTNNGLLLKMDTESDDAYRYDSSDSATAAQRPKLTVVYQV